VIKESAGGSQLENPYVFDHFPNGLFVSIHQTNKLSSEYVVQQRKRFLYNEEG
jgi:hypothetical protein